MKIKASFELITKQFCNGCGVSLMVKSVIPPIDANEDERLLYFIKKSLQDISEYRCPTCDKKTTHIEYYRVFE